MTATIRIAPPSLGPVRLGMSEPDARAALGTLGTVEEGPTGFYVREMSVGVGNDGVEWIVGGPALAGTRFLFRNIDMFQPYRLVLQQLLSLGLSIQADRICYSFAIEDPGLFLSIHGQDDEVFSGVAVSAPSEFAKVFASNPDYRPFTLNDFDKLPTADDDEGDW